MCFQMIALATVWEMNSVCGWRDGEVESRDVGKELVFTNPGKT